MKRTVGDESGVQVDVVELGVADAQRKMASGAFTARALTQAYLDRIDAIDRAGPTLNSVIETSTTGRGLLVLNDTYYPGWEASVDGSPTTIILTDVAFRGVVVEPGAHRVVFDYRPWSVRFGAAVSIAAGIVVGALLLVPATRFCSRRGTARGSIERQL